MAPSIAGFVFLLVADGFKREEEEIKCGELQNAVFLIRAHGTNMYNYMFMIHHSYSHGDVHTNGSCLSMAKDRQTRIRHNAAGKQGEISTSTFHSSMVSICAVLCWLVSPGTDPHALDPSKSRSEVPFPMQRKTSSHIEILPSGQEAISQYPILPEVRDLRNHTHSN